MTDPDPISTLIVALEGATAALKELRRSKAPGRSQVAPEVPAAPEVAPGIAKALLTVPEAAQLLSLGRTTVYGLIRSSRLPVVKIGGCTRVPVEGPVEWVRGLERA